MHSPKAQCPWRGNAHGMQLLEQGTGEVPRQCQAHSGFCGKETVPSSRRAVSSPGAGCPDGALMPAWMWSRFLGSGTDDAKSPVLRKKQFESSTNL